MSEAQPRSLGPRMEVAQEELDRQALNELFDRFQLDESTDVGTPLISSTNVIHPSQRRLQVMPVQYERDTEDEADDGNLFRDFHTENGLVLTPEEAHGIKLGMITAMDGLTSGICATLSAIANINEDSAL